MTSTIEFLVVHIDNPLMRIKLTPRKPVTDVDECMTVLKVETLLANKAWVLDITGCQHGFKDMLVPYNIYLADDACRTIISGPSPYLQTQTNDLDWLLSCDPFPNEAQVQKEDRKMERQDRLHFAEFVNTRVKKDILDGSTAVFKTRLDSFVFALRWRVLQFGR